MRAVGTKVGYRYKTQLGLLSPEWDPSEIAVRSTNSARTIETALELLNGMYPARSRSIPVRIELHAVSAETMYPHSSCSFLGASYKAYRTSEARSKIKSELKQLFDKSEFKSEEEYDFFTRRSLPALCNTLSTLQGHGFPLPQGIRPDHVDSVCDMSGKEYDAMYRSDPRMTRLGIGRFLGEVVDVLKNKVESDLSETSPEQLLGVTNTSEASPAKFVLMSGHDNTIAPLIMSLGILSGTHPPMGSGLAFELYKQSARQTEPEFFVQLVYSGQPLPLPECDYKFMCPFDKFTQIVTPKTPSNYHAECDSEAPFLFK